MKRLRLMLLHEPEIVAYSLLGGTLLASYGLERWAAPLARNLYQVSDSQEAQAMVDGIGLTGCEKIEGLAVCGEKHCASVQGGIIFVPVSHTPSGRHRVDLALEQLRMSREEALEANVWIGNVPLTEAEANVSVKCEALNIQLSCAGREYLSQLAVLSSTAALVLWFKSKGKSNVLLSVSPIIGAFAVQKLQNHANTALVYSKLSAREKRTLRTLFEAELKNNLNQKHFGISSSGNDWFDVARPPLTSRIKMLT